MSCVFVLGAGFSKAVADLPLMKEMVPRIEGLLDEDMKSGENDRCDHAGYVRRFLQDAREMYVDGPLRRKGIEVRRSDFDEDFEFLLTILDLGSSWERHVDGIAPDGKHASYTLGRMGLAPNDKARQSINDYIYRVLWLPQVEWLQLTRFLPKLTPGDVIITFNYDLLLDRALYMEGLWHPSDGYGTTRLEPPPRWCRTPVKSEVLLLKLHGSLNWEIGGDVLELHMFHDADIPYFPDCVETPDPLGLRRPPWSGFGILPSLSKALDSRPILEIWRRAHSVLRTAEELIVIGYSLPKGDSASWTLFATSMNAAQNVVIYSMDDAEEIGSRFANATGCVPEWCDQGLQSFLDT